MKGAVRKIDRALKQLYQLEGKYRAEEYLVKRAAPGLAGALLVRAAGPAALSVGIYLNDGVNKELKKFGKWRPAGWSPKQLGAFTTASEEVSHFHYLLHHYGGGRSVTRLEMELQGEIDKFLLTYFAGALGFEELVERIFFRFRLAEGLSEEEKARYLDANHLAKRFILKYGKDFCDPDRRDRLFQLLRRFYRLNTTEKISLISG